MLTPAVAAVILVSKTQPNPSSSTMLSSQMFFVPQIYSKSCSFEAVRRESVGHKTISRGKDKKYDQERKKEW